MVNDELSPLFSSDSCLASLPVTNWEGKNATKIPDFNSKYSRNAFAFHQIILVCAVFYSVWTEPGGCVPRNLIALNVF